MFQAVKTATVGVCAAIALCIPASALAAGPELTTWLFAEGSTNGAFGFEQEILIGNPNTTPITVTFELFTQDGEALAPVVRTLEPLSRYGENIRGLVGDRVGIAIRLTSSAPIIAERTMYWGGGLFRGGKSWNQKVNDLRGGHNEHGQQAAAKTWYFAEGEGKFFNTFISVANPNNTPATVTASYRDDAGVEVAQTDVVPANGRRTFWPTAVLSGRLQPGRAGFATIVTSDLDVVAERQMYWGPGAPSGIHGGHAAAGVTTPSATWLFAEGIQGALSTSGDPAFDTFVLFFNQNETPIDVKVEFFGQAGAKLAETTRTIGGLTRDGVWAKELPGLINQAFSIRATSTMPFVAERAVYWRGLTEGTATAGATAAALKWGFAEGLQGGFQMYQDDSDNDKRRFNTFFPIYNPGPVPATVTVYFYTEGGNSGTTKTLVVPAQSRETVWTLLYDELANAKFATFFSSTAPIVVERVVYWGRNNKAGHASMGIPLADDFPLTPAPALRSNPSGLTVSPSRGVPGGGTKVMIEGAGFGNTELGTQVLFGGVPARDFEVENDTLIRAVTPPGATGKVDVTVETRGQTITAPAAFEYFDPWAAVGAPINTFRRNTGYACSGGGRACQIMASFLGNVADMARRQSGDIANSCRAFGGNEKFVEDVIAELRIRTGTNRWGMNIKRGNQGLSEDIVTYYYGPEGSDMRNSTQVFIIDIIANHCNPADRFGGGPFWLDQTQATADAGTIGRWTLGPMCSNARYRNAVNPNTGSLVFPECQ
ncbi:IPT/TIG domain protein [Luteitalea pratensis]|uniref:IPT/TIG domain protein n=2 Tax=Luteitalea pratensis TaxID=1855912 RepID=A0A143PMN3_LUTPR|nr:IPT/TIG domain protein [Luteitalea pratensis]